MICTFLLVFLSTPIFGDITTTYITTDGTGDCLTKEAPCAKFSDAIKAMTTDDCLALTIYIDDDADAEIMDPWNFPPKGMTVQAPEDQGDLSKLSLPKDLTVQQQTDTVIMNSGQLTFSKIRFKLEKFKSESCPAGLISSEGILILSTINIDRNKLDIISYFLLRANGGSVSINSFICENEAKASFAVAPVSVAGIVGLEWTGLSFNNIATPNSLLNLTVDTISLIGSTFESISSTEGGSALFSMNSSDKVLNCKLNNCKFKQCISEKGMVGGVISLTSLHTLASFSMIQCTFEDNQLTTVEGTKGGAIFIKFPQSSSITIPAGTVFNGVHKAEHGKLLYIECKSLPDTVTSSTFAFALAIQEDQRENILIGHDESHFEQNVDLYRFLTGFKSDSILVSETGIDSIYCGDNSQHCKTLRYARTRLTVDEDEKKPKQISLKSQEAYEIVVSETFQEREGMDISSDADVATIKIGIEMDNSETPLFRNEEFLILSNLNFAFPTAKLQDSDPIFRMDSLIESRKGSTEGSDPKLHMNAITFSSDPCCYVQIAFTFIKASAGEVDLSDFSLKGTVQRPFVLTFPLMMFSGTSKEKLTNIEVDQALISASIPALIERNSVTPVKSAFIMESCIFSNIAMKDNSYLSQGLVWYANSVAESSFTIAKASETKFQSLTLGTEGEANQAPAVINLQVIGENSEISVQDLDKLVFTDVKGCMGLKVKATVLRVEDTETDERNGILKDFAALTDPNSGFVAVASDGKYKQPIDMYYLFHSVSPAAIIYVSANALEPAPTLGFVPGYPVKTLTDAITKFDNFADQKTIKIVGTASAEINLTWPESFNTGLIIGEDLVVATLTFPADLAVEADEPVLRLPKDTTLTTLAISVEKFIEETAVPSSLIRPVPATNGVLTVRASSFSFSGLTTINYALLTVAQGSVTINDLTLSMGQPLSFAKSPFVFEAQSAVVITTMAITNVTVTEGSIIGLGAETFTMTESKFEDITTTNAAAICLTSGKATLTTSTFSYCSSGDDTNGGAIFISGAETEVVMNDMSFVQCQAKRGGAIYIAGGTEETSGPKVTLHLQSITSCSADDGGALYMKGKVNSLVIDTDFVSCQARRGGAVFLSILKQGDIPAPTEPNSIVAHFKNCAVNGDDVAGSDVFVEDLGVEAMTNETFPFQTCDTTNEKEFVAHKHLEEEVDFVEWMKVSQYTRKVSTVDPEEDDKDNCGLLEKGPCKTIAQAISLMEANEPVIVHNSIPVYTVTLQENTVENDFATIPITKRHILISHTTGAVLTTKMGDGQDVLFDLTGAVSLHTQRLSIDHDSNHVHNLPVVLFKATGDADKQTKLTLEEMTVKRKTPEETAEFTASFISAELSEINLKNVKFQGFAVSKPLVSVNRASKLNLELFTATDITTDGNKTAVIYVNGGEDETAEAIHFTAKSLVVKRIKSPSSQKGGAICVVSDHADSEFNILPSQSAESGSEFSSCSAAVEDSKGGCIYISLKKSQTVTMKDLNIAFDKEIEEGEESVAAEGKFIYLECSSVPLTVTQDNFPFFESKHVLLKKNDAIARDQDKLTTDSAQMASFALHNCPFEPVFMDPVKGEDLPYCGHQQFPCKTFFAAVVHNFFQPTDPEQTVSVLIAPETTVDIGMYLHWGSGSRTFHMTSDTTDQEKKRTTVEFLPTIIPRVALYPNTEAFLSVGPMKSSYIDYVIPQSFIPKECGVAPAALVRMQSSGSGSTPSLTFEHSTFTVKGDQATSTLSYSLFIATAGTVTFTDLVFGSAGKTIEFGEQRAFSFTDAVTDVTFTDVQLIGITTETKKGSDAHNPVVRFASAEGAGAVKSTFTIKGCTFDTLRCSSEENGKGCVYFSSSHADSQFIIQDGAKTVFKNCEVSASNPSTSAGGALYISLPQAEASETAIPVSFPETGTNLEFTNNKAKLGRDGYIIIKDVSSILTKTNFAFLGQLPEQDRIDSFVAQDSKYNPYVSIHALLETVYNAKTIYVTAPPTPESIEPGSCGQRGNPCYTLSTTMKKLEASPKDDSLQLTANILSAMDAEVTPFDMQQASWYLTGEEAAEYPVITFKDTLATKQPGEAVLATKQNLDVKHLIFKIPTKFVHPTLAPTSLISSVGNDASLLLKELSIVHIGAYNNTALEYTLVNVESGFFSFDTLTVTGPGSNSPLIFKSTPFAAHINNAEAKLLHAVTISMVEVETGPLFTLPHQKKLTLQEWKVSEVKRTGKDETSKTSGAAVLHIDGSDYEDPIALELDTCTFTLVESAKSEKGGAISFISTNGFSSFIIKGKTTFESCKAMFPSLVSKGGALYIHLFTSDEITFEAGLQFKEYNSAGIGKDMYLFCNDLIKVVTDVNLNFLLDCEKFRDKPNSLMGQDRTRFKSEDISMYTFLNGFKGDTVVISDAGTDHKLCGGIDYPCKLLDFAKTKWTSASTSKTIKVKGAYTLAPGLEWQYVSGFTFERATALPDDSTPALLHLKGNMETPADKTAFIDNQKTLTVMAVSIVLPEAFTGGSPGVILQSGTDDAVLRLSELNVQYLATVTPPAANSFKILRVTGGTLTLASFYLFHSTTQGGSPAVTFETSPILIEEPVKFGQKLSTIVAQNVVVKKGPVIDVQTGVVETQSINMQIVAREDDGAAVFDLTDSADAGRNITLQSLQVHQCEAKLSMNGGAVSVTLVNGKSSLTITNSYIISSECAGNGGGIHISVVAGVVIKIDRLTLSGCKAAENGGGMYLDGGNIANGESSFMSKLLFLTNKAKNGGGLYTVFAAATPGTASNEGELFTAWVFTQNNCSEKGADVFIEDNQATPLSKAPFDKDSFSTLNESRLFHKPKNTEGAVQDDWLKFGSLSRDVSPTGEDTDKCGTAETPCKSLKHALSISSNFAPTMFKLAKGTHDADTASIILEEQIVSISGETTPQDTTFKVSFIPTDGDKAFISVIKNTGVLQVQQLTIQMDTACDGLKKHSLFCFQGNTLDVADSVITANSVDSIDGKDIFMMEGGMLFLTNVLFRDIHMSGAVVLTQASAMAVTMKKVTCTDITTKSETHAPFHFETCFLITLSDCIFTNVRSTTAQTGGAIYVHIPHSVRMPHLQNIQFKNCTNAAQEAMGGAIYMALADEVTGKLHSSIDRITFVDCDAKLGKVLYIETNNGVENIPDNFLNFEMKECYGEENLFVVGPKDGKDTKDLLKGENAQPFVSKEIIVGGDSKDNKQSCGRVAEPCAALHKALDHVLQGTEDVPTVSISKGIDLKIGVEVKQQLRIKSSGEGRAFISISYASTTDHVSYALLHISALTTFERLDIGYPHHFATEIPALIQTNQIDATLTKVTFSPEDKEEVIPGEFKILNVVGGTVTLEEVEVQGAAKQSASHALSMLGIFGFRAAEDPICSWTSSVVQLKDKAKVVATNCKFIDAISGAIEVLGGSELTLDKAKFTGNKPSSQQYGAMRHNLICSGEQTRVELRSLAEGSDGEAQGSSLFFVEHEGCKIEGTATEKRDSLFFVPKLTKASIQKTKSNRNNAEEVVPIHLEGETLLPCSGLVAEVGRKDGETSKFAPFPLVFTSDSKATLSVPESAVTLAESSAIVVRLAYTFRGEQKTTNAIELVVREPGKTDPSPKGLSPIVIISAAAGGAVLIVAIIIIICCICARRSRRSKYARVEEQGVQVRLLGK